MESSYNIRGALGSPLKCCQSLPFFQGEVKCLNVHKLGLYNGVCSIWSFKMFLYANINSFDICVKKLFKTPDTLIRRISDNDFHDLLNLATKESFFTFNNKLYIQVDGVAMGSPLGPSFANIFLSHQEENWLNKCPINFKPSFYR